jgi:mannose-1-phosphate guanylyltransferase/mannose-6-phosphate isomerase
MIPIILGGGSGTRLWPLSRPSYPKQFHALLGDRSLFSLTLARAQNVSPEKPIVVCGEAHRHLAQSELEHVELADATIIIEPEAKNTAPAIALAVAHACRAGDAEFLVLPSDHMVADQKAWGRAILRAGELLQDGHIVCLGAQISHADSNYGYIQRGEPLGKDAFCITAFKEKPTLDTAETYMRAGDCYWNCGIFAFRGSDYLKSLKEFAPKIFTACQKAIDDGAALDEQFVRPNAKHYASCPSISIDYALMEHAPRSAVVPVSCGWSDLGNWDAVWSAAEQDKSGNMISGDVVQQGCTNNVLMSNSRLLAALNVDNLIAVEMDDAVMVASKKNPQDVKALYAQLQREDRKESRDGNRVYRPWGYYQVLIAGENFQVKLISVNPAQRLSLQMHEHRAEHWIVVKGIGLVQCDEREFTLEVNQSTQIPIRSKHRLSNESDEELQIIEVQSGSYLGEDDIVRFDDIYGR